MYFINLEKGQFTNMEPQILSKRLNWQFPHTVYRILQNVDEQPFSLVLYEFSFAKFNRPNVQELKI